MALGLLTPACSVSTHVGVVATSGSGAGTVTVVVTFDPSAVSAVGGLGALRSDLDASGLSSAGWVVTGPSAGAGGGAVITATHPFSGSSDLAAVMSSVAGPGVFSARLAVDRGFWTDTYRLTVTADLSCGFSCFGDAGLKQSTGSPVGVGVPPASAAGNFHFVVDGRLPDGTRSTAAVALGEKVPLVLTASLPDRAHRMEVWVGAAALVVLVIVICAALWLRRRRSAAGPDPVAVTPGP